MGKNLHYSIVNFIKERLNECDKIETFNFISNDNYYIIQVNRYNPFETFNIYISDEYRYTLTDYYNKPKEIRRGDFIYLARPEANFSDEIELLEISLNEGIYIGKFARLLNFINRTFDDANKSTIIYLNKLKEEEKNRNCQNRF